MNLGSDSSRGMKEEGKADKRKEEIKGLNWSIELSKTSGRT